MPCRRPDCLCAHRARSLQSARAAYDDYRAGCDRVLHLLSCTPSYEPQETDSLSQVETKLNNQKVGGRPHHHRHAVAGGQQAVAAAHQWVLGKAWRSCALMGPWLPVPARIASLTPPCSVPCTGPGRLDAMPQAS